MTKSKQKVIQYIFEKYELTMEPTIVNGCQVLRCNHCNLPNCNGWRHDPQAVYLYPTCCDCGIELNDLLELLQEPWLRNMDICDICSADCEPHTSLNYHFLTHFYKSTEKHESKFQCINCLESSSHLQNSHRNTNTNKKISNNNNQNIPIIYYHHTNGKLVAAENVHERALITQIKMETPLLIEDLREEIINDNETYYDRIKFEREEEIECDDPQIIHKKSTSDSVCYAENTTNGRIKTSRFKNIFTSVQPLKFECSSCAQAFDTKVDLNYHRRIIHSTTRITPEVLQCRMCNLEFYEKKNRADHEATFHLNTETNMYECPHCGVFRKTGSSLEYHMLNHLNDKPHICSICGKAFRRLHNLNGHYETHSSVKIHKCHLCDKSFNTMPLRNRHLRLAHTDIRPYECSVCQKKYKDFSDLRRHKWTHGGYEKKFKCMLCTKAFFENKLLKSHMKTHKTGTGK